MFQVLKLLKNTMLNELIMLPAPWGLSYLWNLGSMLGWVMFLQIFSGIFLTFLYTNDSSLAFFSVESIERLTFQFAIFRLLHVNCVNLFFLFVYLHMSRGLYMFSFRLIDTWSSGMLIYILLMGSAFLGYVLPWGQMSLWGATVITNLMSVIPMLGEDLVSWIWWGFSINNFTLKIFFSLHFLLPLILVVVVVLHVVVLHFFGSSNLVGMTMSEVKLSFDPFFTQKDLISIVVIGGVIFWFNKDNFLDPENYLMADEMSSPIHIKPEWYFLFVYAILRAVPQKSGGVLALALSLVFLYMMVLSSKSFLLKNYFYIFSFFGFSANFFILTWIGGNPVEFPYITIGQISSIFYFYFLLNLLLNQKMLRVFLWVLFYMEN